MIKNNYNNYNYKKFYLFLNLKLLVVKNFIFMSAPSIRKFTLDDVTND